VRFLQVLALALTLTLPTVLLAQPAKNGAPRKPDPDVLALAEANNEFALNFYRHAAAKDEGNLFISPYSISSALAMTYVGARGKTAEEMKTTLHFKLENDRLNAAFSKLITQLDGEGKPRPFQLTVANRLWGQAGYGFSPEFLKTTSEFYHAGLEEKDFIKSPEEARKAINEWVEKQTKEKIKDLIPPNGVSPATRLVLSNAIYFKASWLEQFKPRATKAGQFQLGDGKSVEAQLMNISRHMPYADLESFAVLQVPYEGNSQSMIILLPKKNDGLADLEKQLTNENLTSWLPKLKVQLIQLKLPKFKTTSQLSLKKTLEEMGMKEPFIFGKADFSGIASVEKLVISDVFHKAYVDVNETGTEAAAATAVLVGAGSVPPTPVPFHADHPFIYLIRDNVSGSILFAGRLTNPSK
jgi:serpin B